MRVVQTIQVDVKVEPYRLTALSLKYWGVLGTGMLNTCLWSRICQSSDFHLYEAR